MPDELFQKLLINKGLCIQPSLELLENSLTEKNPVGVLRLAITLWQKCTNIIMPTSSRIMCNFTKLKSSDWCIEHNSELTKLGWPPQSLNRSSIIKAPLGCIVTGDLHDGSAADKSAATV